jgi:hypothetical protein
MKLKKIKPLSLRQLEDISTDAEFPSVGLIGNTNPDPIKEAMKQARNVLILSGEIKRLRLTYGEKWWIDVTKTQKEIDAERKLYERK